MSATWQFRLGMVFLATALVLLQAAELRDIRERRARDEAFGFLAVGFASIETPVSSRGVEHQNSTPAPPAEARQTDETSALYAPQPGTSPAHPGI